MIEEVYVMENKDIVEMLDAITNYINREEYKQALNYIKGKKAEVSKKIDPSSDYIDDLIKNLK